jgi:hypothetical protein
MLRIDWRYWWGIQNRKSKNRQCNETKRQKTTQNIKDLTAGTPLSIMYENTSCYW